MWLQKVKVRQFKSVHLNRVALAWVCHDRACLGKQNIGMQQKYLHLQEVTILQNECKAMASIKHYQPLSTNMLDIIIIMGVIIVIIIIVYNCVTQLTLYTLDKLSSPLFCCLCVCVLGIDNTCQISTFSNIYRHTSPLLTLYHLIPSSTNLY